MTEQTRQQKTSAQPGTEVSLNSVHGRGREYPAYSVEVRLTVAEVGELLTKGRVRRIDKLADDYKAEEAWIEVALAD